MKIDKRTVPVTTVVIQLDRDEAFALVRIVDAALLFDNHHQTLAGELRARLRQVLDS